MSSSKSPRTSSLTRRDLLRSGGLGLIGVSALGPVSPSLSAAEEKSAAKKKAPAAPPAELEATVRLAKYLIADMRHEEETLNRWADEMQNRYDLEYTTPF